MTTQTLASNFVDAARTYLGVPLLHQGRTRDGIDCLGLVVCAARDVGIQITDNLNYGKTPNFREMYDGLTDHCGLVSFPERQVGDLIWIQFPRAAYPHHLMIVDIDDRYLHAEPRVHKRVVRQRLTKSLKSCVKYTLRFKGFIDG